jgi:hypothetical protein
MIVHAQSAHAVWTAGVQPTADEHVSQAAAAHASDFSMSAASMLSTITS